MSDLDRLFYWRGIAPDFYSFSGQLTPVPIENRVNILQAMGVDTSTPESIAKAAYELDIKPWLSWLPPLEVLALGHLSVDINLRPEDLEEVFSWVITGEGGQCYRGSFKPADCPEVGDYTHEGVRFSRRSLAICALAIGYYKIEITQDRRTESTVLAVVPDAAYIPASIEQSSSGLWGFIIQLYTLRSQTNWGIGDFTDLRNLLRYGAKYGVDVVGLNPFHALQVDLDHNSSPYSPSDRRFLNPLYIDVEQVDGYDPSYGSPETILRLRNDGNVQYSTVRELKYTALYQCFEHYALKLQTAALVEFIERNDDALADYVNYESRCNWVHSGVPVSAATHRELISALKSSNNVSPELMMPLFYTYLQWISEEQLQQCQVFAESLGMKVGLVRDLAVGASGGGAEVQTNRQLFCDDAAIGAPPDPMALTGQNWGIPPIEPAEFRRTGFRHFITLLRSNMAHCGALRIDHAMSLFRLWWCPPGESADKGAYIYYPFKELLGLLCLESHLNRCVIIAEDLGSVPDEFRQAMTRTKLFGNRVFYFEKWNEHEFKHPSDYDRHALAMLSNHDVPTVVSWWDTTDLQLRARLKMLGENADIDQLVQSRNKEKSSVLALLDGEGLLPESWQHKSVDASANDELIFAIIRYAIRANSSFFMLQLDDLMLMDAPVNVPGTFLEHANWCRKLERTLDELFNDNKVDELLSSISHYRNLK